MFQTGAGSRKIEIIIDKNFLLGYKFKKTFVKIARVLTLPPWGGLSRSPAGTQQWRDQNDNRLI